MAATQVIKRTEPSDEWHGEPACTGDEYWTSPLIERRQTGHDKMISTAKKVLVCKEGQPQIVKIMLCIKPSPKITT